MACCPHNAARYDARKLSATLQRPGEPEVNLSNLVIGTGRTQQIRGGVRKCRIRDMIHPNSLKIKKGTVYEQDRESPSTAKHMKHIIPRTALGLSADQIQSCEDGNGGRWTLHVRDKPTSALFASNWTKTQTPPLTLTLAEFGRRWNIRNLSQLQQHFTDMQTQETVGIKRQQVFPVKLMTHRTVPLP